MDPPGSPPAGHRRGLLLLSCRPRPFRFTPATLCDRDRGRGWGGGWEALAGAGGDRRPTAEHRRDLLRLRTRRARPSRRMSSHPGGALAAGEIRVMIRPPNPFHGRDSPRTGTAAAGTGGRSWPWRRRTAGVAPKSIAETSIRLPSRRGRSEALAFARSDRRGAVGEHRPGPLRLRTRRARPFRGSPWSSARGAFCSAREGASSSPG